VQETISVIFNYINGKLLVYAKKYIIGNNSVLIFLMKLEYADVIA